MASLEHPTVFSPTTCVRKGLCPVTQLRPQGPTTLESHSLYYEQHGHGTRHKLVFIMGLNASSFGWGAQVRHFAAMDGYTVLVFDNRGVGNSGYPRGPYTTTGMAEDVICLLDFLGWTAEREVNIVGISLGGMIAQELAYRIPNRIASLTLAVTTPGGHIWQNFPPWNGVKALTTLLLTPDLAKKAPIMMEMLFPVAWLQSIAEDDPQGRTNRDVQIEDFLRRVSITRPQQLIGHISQMAAGLTHHVSPARLQHISRSVPKVTIVTGDEDNLVLPAHSREIKASMPEAELVEWKGTGHAIHTQRRELFNALIERTIREGWENVQSTGPG